MEQVSSKSSSKTKLIFFATGLLLAAAAAGGWFYYSSRLRDMPPPTVRLPQGIRPIARIVVAPEPSGTPSTGTPSEPPSPPSNVPERPRFHAERNSMNELRQDFKNSVLVELAPAFPQLQAALNDREENRNDRPYQQLFFQLLAVAEKAPRDQRPAILFAADLVGGHLGCDTSFRRDQLETACVGLRNDLARYHITLKNDELGAGLYYPHDLLWRIWQDYPATDWGERVFVLLLDRGWDTSNTCEKGEDQTREVIRQGEAFLQHRPSSPYRGAVTLLVAEAYASWWSLSNEPAGSDMSGYVDPKHFQEGAEEARIKAIGYFEEVLQLAPGTKLSEFAQQVLPPLRKKQVLDNYRFFCVYD
jgi:hypothetical protein